MGTYRSVVRAVGISRLTETKRAYDKLIALLNQEIRKRSGSTQDLERFRQTLDVAFYLLG